MKPANSVRTFIAYLVLILTLFAVSSCATSTGRTSGEVIDDTAITTKIKAKLYDENILRGIVISVDTFHGDVTLTGAVESRAQKLRAGDIAKSVEGVRKVNNYLKIKTSSLADK